MSLIFNCLLILAGVFISGKMARALRLPAPLVQIAMGFLIASMGRFEIPIEPHAFMFFFLASLLFLDGSRLPFDEVKKDGFLVISMAFGLVVGTAIGLGLLLNMALPGMPLPVAIGLAAIISLTDPIAVSAIAQRAPIPPRMMHILEGESLLNDASGLVCMRFAVVAATTGVFIVSDAASVFTVMVVWGLAIGILTTLSFTILMSWFNRRYGEISHDQVIASVLMAFGSFWIAEFVHASGVLAAVSAGVTMAIMDSRGTHMAKTRIQRKHFWDTLQYALNGAIFILMGEQLPRIIRSLDKAADQAGHAGQPLWLVAYIFAIFVFLIVTRFLWCWVSASIDTWRHRNRDRRDGDEELHDPSMSVRACLAMSFAGVRGAVTLAGILSFPVLMPDGSPFPGRELAVVLSVGVILVSLIVSSIVLPYILDGLDFPAGHGNPEAERMHRMEGARRAMAAAEKMHGELGDRENMLGALNRVLDRYRPILETEAVTDEDRIRQARREEEAEHDMTLAAIRGMRDYYFEARRKKQIDEISATTEIHALDLAEARLMAQGH